MTNSSDTFKTGEKATEAGQFSCLNCRQMGKSTTIEMEKGAIFLHCTVCETKDATWRLVLKPVRR